MKYLFWLLVFTLSIQGQTLLTEYFSNFRDTTASSLTHSWVFDSTYAEETKDHVGSFNLTKNGTITTFQSSPMRVDGYCRKFDGSTGYYSTSNSNIATNFTISYWFRRDDGTNPGGGMRFIQSDNGSTLRNFFLFYHGATNSLRLSIYISNSIYTIQSTLQGAALWADVFDAAWHNLIVTHDGSNLRMYVDGESYATAVAAAGSIDQDAVAIFIGTDALGVEDWDGYTDQIQTYSIAMTPQQVKEATFLAPGWASNGGGVTRANYAFHQGIVADTVYYATVLTAGNWSVTVNVDGAAGGESLEVLTSADASAWSTIGTISVTTDATDYTVTGTGLGYIGFGLTSGTVYIDNLTVTLNATATKPGYKAHTGWKQSKTHKTFINK